MFVAEIPAIIMEFAANDNVNNLLKNQTEPIGKSNKSYYIQI